MSTPAQSIKDSVILISKVTYYVLRNTTYAAVVTLMFLMSIALWVNILTASTNAQYKKADRILRAHNSKLSLVWARF